MQNHHVQVEEIIDDDVSPIEVHNGDIKSSPDPILAETEQLVQEVEEVMDPVEEVMDPVELEKRLVEAEELKTTGNEYFQKFEYGEAIDKYTKALDLIPKNHPKASILYGNRAAAYLQLEDWTNAASDGDKALAIDPNYVKAFNRRAMANHKLGEFKKALEDYQKVVELQPGMPNAVAQKAIKELPPLIQKKEEAEREKMMSDFKDLGNKFLGLFGLSTDNFEATKDEKTGSYSIQFNQNPQK